MKMGSTTFAILTMNTLWTICWAIPLMDLKNTLDESVVQPIVTSACSPNGECWGWLPVQETRENIEIVPDDLEIPRSHTRRQVTNTDPNVILEPWGENIPPLQKKIQPFPATIRQNGNKMMKKDIFVSRTWGAGGMPFSVLYMTPHGPRGNHASSTQQQEMGKTTESSTPPLGHPNSRISLRNGPSGQPRRQYSIIPQLFISYGWGPFGK